MRAHIREQVVDNLPQPVTIAHNLERLELNVDRPFAIDHASCLDRLVHNLVQRDRLLRERPPLVKARKQQ